MATKWSKKSLSSTSKVSSGYMDTYLNLLFKCGKVDEALKWKTKAQNIAIQEGADKKSYQNTINKMENKEKTW